MALENRLEKLNSQRQGLLDDVVERVVSHQLAAARLGGDAALEYVLNDVCYEETKRIESAGGDAARWSTLASRLHGMSEQEKVLVLRTMVSNFAEDIVGVFNPTAYKVASRVIPSALGFLLAPIHSLRDGANALTSMDSRIVVGGEVDVIRRCAKRGTLVVAPTHSSHLDSPAIGFGLQREGLPPVTYGAGANLFANPFMSYFLRNLGAYRVDRRLKFSLYKDVLKAYSTVLLERGYHSLFFPGGTRCRSNLVERQLKLGLLGTSLAAYANNVRAGRDARVYVVPATINYRLVLEAETLIADYLAERGKRRYIIMNDESSELHRLVDFFRKIFALEGSVVVQLGRPLDPLGHSVDDDGESLDRRGRMVDPRTFLIDSSGQLTDDTQRDAEYTRRLGQQLAQAYVPLLVLHSTAIVARTLWDRLARKYETRDVYRLLRADHSLPVCTWQEACLDVDAWQAFLRSHPAFGQLHTTSGTTSTTVMEDAMRGLSSYHTNIVAERRGDNVYVRDVALLFFYANRLAHIERLA